MPANTRFDYLLGKSGFMLQRASGMKGRAWHKSGRTDTPGQRSANDAQFGVLPDELDHPEVWNDWSGGIGDAYRDPSHPNEVHWSENFDTRWPGQMVHAQQMQLLPARYASLNTNVVNLIDVPFPSINTLPGGGGVQVLAKGRLGRLYPTGLTTAGSAFDVGDYAETSYFGGAGKPAIFGSYLHITTDDGDGLILAIALNDSSQYVNLDGDKRGYANAGNRLWAYQSNIGGRRTTVRSLAAGQATISAALAPANWSATLHIGNGQANITDMIAMDDQLFIGAENGLYAGDFSGTFNNVLADLTGQVHQDNCRDLAVHGGQVIAQHAYGISAYRPEDGGGIVRDIGPPMNSSRSPIQGRVRALKQGGQWLYAGLWTGSQSYLMAGRDADGVGPYKWHVLNRFPHYTRVHRLHIDSFTTSSGNARQMPNRLWAVTDMSLPTNGTAPLYFWPIPQGGGNPLAPQVNFTGNYVGSARVDLQAVNWQAPGTFKGWRSFEVEAENLAASTYADVYYTVDNGTRTLLGTAKTSPKTTLYFPSGEGSFVTGQSIAMSIESFIATSNVTPVYRTFVLRGFAAGKSVALITAQTRIADRMTDRASGIMRPGALQLDELNAMAATAGQYELTDLAGRKSFVKVLPPIEETEVYQVGSEYPEVNAVVRMAVMEYTSG